MTVVKEATSAQIRPDRPSVGFLAIGLVLLVMIASMVFSYVAIADAAKWVGNGDGIHWIAPVFVDGAMTLLSLDCWYQREAGKPPETAVAHFFAEHFDNQYMENRFQSMSIDPGNATRAK